MAYGVRARIRPGIELNRIEIHLRLDGPPLVRCIGTVRHARTRRTVGQAQIDTILLGAAGVAFIQEIKAAFGEEARKATAAVPASPNPLGRE